MAISTPSFLGSLQSTAAATSVTTGSLSPTGNALLIVVVGLRDSGDEIHVNSVTDTFTGTGSWTEHCDISYQEGGGSWTNCTIYTAQAGSTPGSGTITANLNASCNRRTITVQEVASGFNTTTPVKNTKTGTSTSSTPSITLDSSPDSDSCVIGAIAAGGEDSLDPAAGTNYTELTAAQIAITGDPTEGKITTSVEYDLTPTSTTVDWSGGSTTANALAVIEIDAAGAATPAPSVQDDVDVSESITAAVSAGIASIQDDATITETVTARLLSFISAQDDATIAELITAAVSDPQIDITENATIAELVSALVSSPQITITDDATLADDVTVTVTGGADVAAYINISPSANYIQVVTP